MNHELAVLHHLIFPVLNHRRFTKAVPRLEDLIAFTSGCWHLLKDAVWSQQNGGVWYVSSPKNGRKWHRIFLHLHISTWSMGIPGSDLMEVPGTICLAIFWGHNPLDSPKQIGLIYGRYLQFRLLKWPLTWYWHDELIYLRLNSLKPWFRGYPVIGCVFHRAMGWFHPFTPKPPQTYLGCWSNPEDVTGKDTRPEIFHSSSMSYADV